MTFFRQIFGAALIVLCMTAPAFAQAEADKVAPAAAAPAVGVKKFFSRNKAV